MNKLTKVCLPAPTPAAMGIIDMLNSSIDACCSDKFATELGNAVLACSKPSAVPADQKILALLESTRSFHLGIVSSSARSLFLLGVMDLDQMLAICSYCCEHGLG